MNFKSFFYFLYLIMGCNFGIKGELADSDKARDFARVLEKKIKKNNTDMALELISTQFLFSIVAFFAFIKTGILSISALAQSFVALDAYYTNSSSREFEKKKDD